MAFSTFFGLRVWWCLLVPSGIPICQNAFITALNLKMPTPWHILMSTWIIELDIWVEGRKEHILGAFLVDNRGNITSWKLISGSSAIYFPSDVTPNQEVWSFFNLNYVCVSDSVAFKTFYFLFCKLVVWFRHFFLFPHSLFHVCRMWSREFGDSYFCST